VRILFLALYPPYPPDDGGRIRTLNILKQVAQRHQLTLLAFSDPSRHDHYLEYLQSWCVKVIVIPKPIVGSRSVFAKLRDIRRDKPISLDQYYSREMASAIRDLVRTGGFDVAHIDHIYLAQYVEDLAPLPAVLTHHNVEAIAQKRALCLRPPPFGLRRWFIWREYRRWAKYEVEISQRFGALVAVSQREAAYFQRNVPNVPTFVVPNGVDTEFFRPLGSSKCDQNPTLLYTGRMDYLPNVDAVTWFCREVLPRIQRAYPSVHFHIVGRSPTPEVQALGKLPGVMIVGEVPDVRPYYALATIFVVPLRLGAGTRLKILEAMAMATPVISTTLGCEGLDVEPGKDLIIADTVEEMEVQITHLLENSVFRDKIGQRARLTVKQKYDWQNIVRMQEEAYECAIHRRRVHT
jgi:sugar transferase (PEP-CTERM/EpsH1 system associated)